jgi:hypothetical protein
MAITKYSGRGHWKDRMGYRTNGVGVNVDDFGKLQAFLDTITGYSNLQLLRYMLTATTTERKTGDLAESGHFDLAGYVARLSFYNYTAEDLGDSPNTSLTIPGPKDSMIEETKTGIWVVTETAGNAIATALSTAMNGAEIEFLGGEVPEN